MQNTTAANHFDGLLLTSYSTALLAGLPSPAKLCLSDIVTVQQTSAHSV